MNSKQAIRLQLTVLPRTIETLDSLKGEFDTNSTVIVRLLDAIYLGNIDVTAVMPPSFSGQPAPTRLRESHQLAPTRSTHNQQRQQTVKPVATADAVVRNQPKVAEQPPKHFSEMSEAELREAEAQDLAREREEAELGQYVPRGQGAPRNILSGAEAFADKFGDE